VRLVIVVPLLVGVATVLQGTLNRWLMDRWGLAAAVCVSSVVFGVVSVTVLGAAWARPHWFPRSFAPTGSLSDLSWWFVLPGLFGLVIVFGAPWAIGQLGAARVFVAIVAAQMGASLVWDALAEGIPPTTTRIAGVMLAVVGAWLVGR
jgi:uncharacterized membrane protein YdcZ (DUF606 family)